MGCRSDLLLVPLTLARSWTDLSGTLRRGAQRGKVAPKAWEALGVRGACSRFGARGTVRKRQQAGRTPNASRDRSRGEPSQLKSNFAAGLAVVHSLRWAA